MTSTVRPLYGPASRAGGSLPAVMLALLSGAAAGIHSAVVPEHFEEYWIYGGFFAALTAFQATWAIVILRRPTTPVAAVGVFANTAVLLLWVLSRTAGLPVGAEPWTPEAVGVLDVTAGIAEVGVVALALGMTPAFAVKREAQVRDPLLG